MILENEKEIDDFRLALNKVNQLMKRVHPDSLYIIKGKKYVTYNLLSVCVGNVAKELTRKRLTHFMDYTKDNPILIKGDDLYQFIKKYKKYLVRISYGDDVKDDSNDVALKLIAIHPEEGKKEFVAPRVGDDAHILLRERLIDKYKDKVFYRGNMKLEIHQMLNSNDKAVNIKVGPHPIRVTKSAIPGLTSKSTVEKFGLNVDETKFIVGFTLYRKAMNLTYYLQCTKRNNKRSIGG